MANRRLFRRKEPITAAAQKVDLRDEDAIKAVLKRREKWQSQAFDAYEACGELTYAVDFLAALMSRLTLYPAKAPKDKENDPVAVRSKDPDETDAVQSDEPVDPNAEKVIATFERLGNPDHRANLQRDLSVHLLVPGESWLIGLQKGTNRPNETEVWQAASINEIELKTNSATLKEWGKDGKDLTLVSGSDTWLRIWRPHARYHNKAFSHVKPILDAIDELLWWDAAARARAKSRISDSGLLMIPSNMELPAEKEEEVKLSGTRRLIKRIYDTMVRAISSPGSADAAVPILLTYPANDRGKSGVEYIALNRPQDDLLEKRTDRCLRRIAQGLNVPVEIIFGLGQATHWGGGQIEQSVFREHIEPLALLLVQALTTAFLHPTLKAENVENFEDYIIWYDESNLIVYPQREQAADHGVELGAIGMAAWRRYRGFSESDKPSEEEKLETLAFLQARRGRAYTPTAQEELPKPGQPGADTNQPPIQPPAPGERAPLPRQPIAARGKGQPIAASANGHPNGNGTSLGRRLAEIDADLFTRLQTTCDAAMYRALERAGTQLRTKARKNPTYRNMLRNVASEDVAQTLGREVVIKLGTDDLFTDAFASIPAQFRRACDRTIDAAFNAAGISPTTQQKAIFDISYSTDEAAQFLVRDLKELASIYLFDRAAALEIKPEGDDSLVPARVVRKAMAAAGGGKGTTDLLLATGHAVTQAFAACGLFAPTYEWWYGPSVRAPFAAHQSLDGVQFELGKLPHSPGDTDHCKCISVPIFEG